MSGPTRDEDEARRIARTLSEALPYLRRFAGETFVVKYGGHAMGSTDLAARFARDVALLAQVGINPVVVHGGGPQIGRMLERLKIQSSFVEGLRVTDAATVEIVEMVLSGSINKQVVGAINQAGGRAIGISGKDGRLIQARKLERTTRDPDSAIERVLDLGFVGEPARINAALLADLARVDIIPVVAPIGIGPAGETYNINADTAAGAIAAELKASKLLLLTDVAGVLDGEGNLLGELTPEDARRLIEDGTIAGGMIPKIETCLDAMAGGVEAAQIVDGRVPHVLLIELFTEAGIGTKIHRF